MRLAKFLNWQSKRKDRRAIGSAVFTRFRAYLGALRPLNLLMLTALFLILPHENWPLAAYLNLSIIATAAAGYWLNDAFDVQADAHNRPNRALVLYPLTWPWLGLVYAALLTLALGPWLFLPQAQFFLPWIILVNVLLFIYAIWGKYLAWWGNALVALACTLPLYLYLILSPNLWTKLSYNYWQGQLALAFVATLLRELVKDLQDQQGDALMQARSLPLLWSNAACLRLIRLYALALALIFFWSWGGQPCTAGLFWAALALGMVYHTWVLSAKAAYASLSKHLRIYLALGMAHLFYVLYGT